MKILQTSNSWAKIGLITSLIYFYNLKSTVALDFTFSFDNDGSLGAPGTIQGTVRGFIGGLDDNTTDLPKLLKLTSFPAGLGGPSDSIDLFAPPWSVSTGRSFFTVRNGLITDARLFASGNTGENLCLNYDLCFAGYNNALTFDFDNHRVGNIGGFSSLAFNPYSASVPFESSPTLGLLLVGALFGSHYLYQKSQSQVK